MVGRNYAYQTGSGSTAFFEDAKFNPFAAAGSLGVALDDYNSDNFDHAPHGFVGGASITCAYTNGRPIQLSPDAAGHADLGQASGRRRCNDTYQRVTSVGAQGSVMSYRNNYLDLDPTYKDPLGRPLMRMTFDYQDNEQKMANWMADRCDEIAKAMGAKTTQINRLDVPWNVVPYQTTHNTGGAVMGTDPKTSVLNRYLQSWDVLECVRDGRLGISAERRLQSDRHGRCADLLVARCDQEISEVARPAGAAMRMGRMRLRHLLVLLPLLALVAPPPIRTIMSLSSAARRWRPPAIASPAIPQAAGSPLPAGSRCRRRSARS